MKACIFTLVLVPFALLACGGVATDDVGTVTDELTGVEPDEIDYDSETATTEYDDAGRIIQTTYGSGTNATEIGRRCVFPMCGGVVSSGSEGGSAKETTYGPVITVKPKG